MSSQGARDRFYSSPPSTNSLGMSYAWGPTLEQTGNGTPLTGNWAPLQVDSSGNLVVSLGGSSAAGGVPIQGGNTIPVNVSGTVTAVIAGGISFSGSLSGLTVQVSAVAITGIAPVSGIVQVGNTAPIPTSGVVQANITNTAPLAISGIVLTVVTGSVSSSTDLSPVVLAVASGNRLLSGISGINTAMAASLAGTLATNDAAGNLYLSSISGSLVSLLADNVAVTGGNLSGNALGSLDISHTYLATSGVGTASVSITNTAPIAVSGVVQASVTTVDTGNRSVLIVNPVVAISGVVTTTATVGNVAITGFSSTIAPLAVSGVFSATTDNSTVVSAVASGNNYGLVSNRLLSGVSGLLSANLTDAAWVTGQVSLTNTAPIPVSGVVQATLDPTAIVLAIATGNRYLSGISGLNTTMVSQLAGTLTTNATVTNALLAVSGVFSGKNLGSLDLTHTYLPISGVGNMNVSVANTAPIAVSGVVLTVVTGSISTSVSNPIGVTGTDLDINVVYAANANAPFNFLAIGGRAVNPSGAGSVTGYNTGDYAMLNICAANGAVMMNQGILEQSQDNVTVWTAATGTMGVTPLTSGINNAGWSPGNPVALPANPNRRAWFFQNNSTGNMYLGFGFNPTTGAFNILVKGGTTQFDGNGATYTDAPAIWQGDVRVSGYFNVSPAYTCWQL